MTIGKKLLASFGVLLGLSLVLGAVSWNVIGRLNGRLDQAVDTTYQKADLCGTIGVAAAEMQAAQRGLVAYAYAKSPEGIEGTVRQFENSAGKLVKAADDLRPLLLRPEGKQLLSQLTGGAAEWRSVFREMKQQADLGSPDAALRIGVEKGLQRYISITRDARRIVELQRNILDGEQQEADDLSRASALAVAGVVLLSFVAAVGVFLLVRRITRMLEAATEEMSESASQVANASGQVSASSQALAQGASEQAATLEETSASSEEITSMTRKNADNSRTAADLMSETSQVVTEANATLAQMEKSMSEINASSEKVGRIIKVIDEIAFQTNILALNAAVEAARAGEAGMGFAVVADEVRNLAQRSAQAAKDTASLIEESIAKSVEGRGKLDQVAGAIRAITESADKVKTLVDEVKLGSEEQARGIEQIAKAISQMEQVTQRAAANAEETASAGKEMSAQAASMNETLDRLREMVSGDGGSTELPGHKEKRLPVQKPAARVGEAARTTAGLRALEGAVSRKSDQPVAPSAVPVAKSKLAIPLDDDFKEF